MVLLVSGSLSIRSCHKEVCLVLCRPSYIPANLLDLVENISFAHYSTLQAVVCKPVFIHVLASSINMDLAGMLEWCNHWFMILSPNKN